jgi:putative membrane protein
MSHLRSRSVFALLASLSALGFGCAGTQKSPEASQTEVAYGSAPTPGETRMNGEPTGTPPAEPPPQGLNNVTVGNTMAAPKVGESSATPQPALSEGQIAMITELANTAEIEQGKLAQTKAKSASVKKFAAMMIKHHTEAKNEQAKLTKQLSLTPTQSQDASSLKADAERTLGSLRDASGAQFDVAYIDSQVEAHQQVLDTIDRQLLPSAKSQDVIDNLKKMRETVVSHLEEAKTIQADLAKSSAK